MAAAKELIGIDVSKWQESIVWERVAQQIHWAYIKASQETFKAKRFNENWQGSAAGGVQARGGYHYFVARKDRSSAAKQATFFFETLSSAGDLGEMPPMLDVERNQEGLSQAEYTAAVWKFIVRFEGLAGTRLGIYTSEGKWNDFVGYSGIPEDRTLWVASYRDPAIYWPAMPADFVRWNVDYSLWQWTSKGHVDGIEPCVDLNKYNGDLKRFNSEFKTSVKHPEDTPTLPPPPPAQPPGRIIIDGLQGRQQLNLRSTPAALADLSNWVGSTRNGCQFIVMGQDTDNLDRIWYQIGPSIYVASWYTDPVE